MKQTTIRFFVTSIVVGLYGVSRRVAMTFFLVMSSIVTVWATTETLGDYDFTIESDADGNYYKVDSKEALIALANYVNAGNDASEMRFKQTVDIDMEGVNFTPIGNYLDLKTNVFRGTYDGDAYFIKNISHSITGQNTYSGFIGRLEGIVKNVNLKDCCFAGFCVGGIAGGLGKGSVIQNCNVLGGKITGTDDNPVGSSGSAIGGIVGKNYKQKAVENCFTTTTFGGAARWKGSVVGQSSGESSSIANCFYTNAIDGANNNKGTQITGGFIVLNDGITISDGVWRTIGKTAENTYYFGKSDGIITLSHVNHDGYTFAGYTSSDVTFSGGIFTMPAKDVTINANYQRLPYVVVNVKGGGMVTFGDKTAKDGNPIDILTEKNASVTLILESENGNAVRSIEYGYTKSDGTNVDGFRLPISGMTAILMVPTDLKDGTGVNLTVTFVSALVGGADEASAVALTDATVTDLAGGWYKVESNVTFNHTLNLLANTYLTIADGKTMTISTASGKGIDSEYTLTVGGKGALSVTTTDKYMSAIRIGNYIQTGAMVTANGYIGIHCCDNFKGFTNDFTFCDGQLLVGDINTGSNGIQADNNITINGGIITSIGDDTNAVHVGSGSVFSMTGGMIKGATNGVDLDDGATFTMSGGSITDNRTGVKVNSASVTFTVSGNVNVMGNTEKDVNLYYDGSKFNPIKIGGELASTARIGINIDEDVANIITGDVIKVFTSELSGRGKKSNFVLNGRDEHVLAISECGEVSIAADTWIYNMLCDDNADNSIDIANHNGETVNVTLNGRTLYKDGKWNTLCLPFSLTAEQIAAHADFAGASLMELDTDGKNGFDTTDGTLWLTFKKATAIVAGVPYLVKWDAMGDNLTSPMFNNVIIDATASTMVSDADDGLQEVQMVGCYSPMPVLADDKSILFLGEANMLYCSTVDRNIRPFRTYFSVPYIKENVGIKARAFTLNFDGEKATGILEVSADFGERKNHAWYSLDGVRLSGKPTLRGIYINKGKKIIIK